MGGSRRGVTKPLHRAVARLRHLLAVLLALVREFMWSLMLDVPDDVDEHYREFCEDIKEEDTWYWR